MSEQLLAADIDLLYFVDPLQEKTDLALVKEKFRGRLAVAGGLSSTVTLCSGSREEICQAVHIAVRKLGPEGFILAPVDALFPDTPWSSVKAMIEAWKDVCELG